MPVPHYDNATYSKHSLCDDLAPDLAGLMMPLIQRQLFFLVGSGISVAGPTDLPTGRQLADLLVGWLVDNGMGAIATAIDDATDLGQVCQTIEDHSGRDTLNRLLIETVPWHDAAPNLCHYILALMFNEDVIRRSFTFNWDDKVHEASLSMFLKLSCPVDAPSLSAGADPMFVHLHGHIDHVQTLIATQGDLEQSPLWAEPSLRASIHESEIVLVGFAAEPQYLMESLARFKSLVGKAPFAVVSVNSLEDFKATSASLSDICGFQTEETRSARFVQRDACDVFADLMRVYYCSQLRDILESAKRRAAQLGSGWGCPADSTVTMLQESILRQPLKRFLQQLWHASATGTERPDETRLVPLTQCADPWVNILASLLLLSSCPDVAEVEPWLNGWRIETIDGSQVDFCPIVARTGEHLVTVCSNAGQNTSLLAIPSDADIPLVLITEGGWGNPRLGHPSVVAREEPGNLVSPQRTIVDAVNIGVIQARLGDFPSDVPPEFHKLVTLGGHHG